MENSKSTQSNTGYKGITFNRHNQNKVIAQYFNKELSTTIYIGQFNNIEDAVIARANHIRDVHDGIIDDSLPKTPNLPKGIRLSSSGRYFTFVQYWYGVNKDKIHRYTVGTFDTIDEAVKAREDFIKSLF